MARKFSPEEAKILIQRYIGFAKRLTQLDNQIEQNNKTSIELISSLSTDELVHSVAEAELQNKKNSVFT